MPDAGRPPLPAALDDADVAEAAARGGRLQAGPWTLYLPAVHGFCGGVRNALATLTRVLDTPGGAGRTVWLLGEVIHNETVNAFFAGRGVVRLTDADIPSVFTRARPGDAVVIPAFGLPGGLTEQLRAAERAGAFTVVDTTCGYVQRIWRFAAAEAAAGATVLLQGKPTHPEVQATLARARTGRNAVVQFRDPADAERLVACLCARGWAGYPPELLHDPAHTAWDRVALVAQTTLLFDEVERAEALLRAAAARTGARFHSAATVCGATRERQRAALDVCRRACDLILVVGGFDSSNTTQLYRLAARHTRAYFIRDAAALDPERIRHYLPEHQALAESTGWLSPPPRTIGILSGASCPPCDVGGVIRRLRALATSPCIPF